MTAADLTPAAPVSAPVQTGNSRLARNIAFLAGGQLATWSLSALWTIFVPRALGPRGLGELTIAYAATGVVSVVVSLGVGTLMVKEIARDHAKSAAMLGTAILIRAAFVLPGIAAIALYIRLGRFGGEQAVVIWMATASMILVLFTTAYQAVFQAIERMEFLAYADVLSKAAVTVLSIAIVLMGFGVVPVMAVALSMAFVVLVLNVLWSRGLFGVEWRTDAGKVRSLVLESLPYWSTGLVLTIYMWIDSVMLGFMTSDVVVGWYAVPTKLFNTVLFVPVILGTAYLPRLSRAYRDGAATMAGTGRAALESVLVLALPVAVGVGLVAKPLIDVIYGSAFAPSVVVLVILAVSLPPTYFNIMVNQVLVACGRQLAWTKVMVAAAVINPALNLVLIRYFQAHQHNGAMGAALSLLATEVGMTIAGFALLPRMLNAESISRVARAVAATGGMAAVVIAVRHTGLVVEIVAGAGTFVLLALVFRLLTPAEAALLRTLASRRVMTPLRGLVGM